MNTEVEIVAEAGCRGGTVFEVLRGHGSVAPRRTGEHRVHLVGTAAGPLGGDTVRVHVAVGEGARLQLRSVAATLALPSRDAAASRMELHVTVADDAVLDIAFEPVVVAAAAQLWAQTRLDVAAGGSVSICEQIVLGRCQEAAGQWRGRLHADKGGRPWLRQSISLGPNSPTWDRLHCPRVLISRLRSHEIGGDARYRSAVRAALAAGGTLVTAVGPDLVTATADADGLAHLPA